MELDSRKKSRCDRIMRTKIFVFKKTKEVREIGRKKAGELSHLMHENEKRCLSDGRKGMQKQERLKMCRRKSMPEQEKCFSMGYATLSGPVTEDEERFVSAVRNLAGENGKQREE